MRDVTDNVTGTLSGVEQKRGRGRPRKARAMTNAERQAAFRARRKMQGLSAGGATVTEKPADVDAYDECQLEAEALRGQLDALRHQLSLAETERNRAFMVVDKVREDLAETQKRYQDLTDGYHRKCEELNQAVAAAALAREQRRGTVTSDDKSVTTAQWLALLGVACKGKTERQKDALGHSEACRLVARLLRGGDFDRLRDAIYGP